MMEWDLDFISQKDFDAHIEETISKYGEALLPYSLKRLNSNLIDPVKLIFDKSVYGSSWEETIKSEVFRQRDKSGNNSIGYFHQRMFNYIGEYAKEHDVRYYNLFYEIPSIGLDDSTDWMDRQHLNCYGQEKFTRYMVEKGYLDY